MREGEGMKKKQKVERKPKIRLVDIESITPIRIAYYNRNFAKFQVQEITIREDKPQITIEAIQDYVRNLQNKYPQEGFAIREEEVDGKKFIVVDKSNPKAKMKTIPIYFNIEENKIYFRRYDIGIRRKLSRIIAWRILGMFKWSKIKAYYFRTKEEVREFLNPQAQVQQ